MVVINVSIFSGLKVLYVDNDPENLQALSYALLDECDVVTCQSAQEALGLLETDRSIAVVIADLRLSEMDGLEFLQRAAKINPVTVRLIFTTDVDERPAIAALNSGVCDGYHKEDEAFAGHRLIDIVYEASERYAKQYAKRAFSLQNAVAILARLFEQALKQREPEVGPDCVDKLVELLLPYLDIPIVDKEMLKVAAIVFDIGRLVTADPSPAAQTEATRTILGGLPGLEQCLTAAIDHHETWDGSGPQGKRGAEISLFGRILAVVHTFNWLAAHDNKNDLTPAVTSLDDGASTKFDPQVVQAFRQMWDDHRAEIEALYRS